MNSTMTSICPLCAGPAEEFSRTFYLCGTAGCPNAGMDVPSSVVEKEESKTLLEDIKQAFPPRGTPNPGLYPALAGINGLLLSPACLYSGRCRSIFVNACAECVRYRASRPAALGTSNPPIAQNIVVLSGSFTNTVRVTYMVHGRPVVETQLTTGGQVRLGRPSVLEGRMPGWADDSAYFDTYVMGWGLEWVDRPPANHVYHAGQITALGHVLNVPQKVDHFEVDETQKIIRIFRK